MSKVGIITYHAAYNYGSVLQAFALFHDICNIYENVSVINYRPIGQKRFYCIFRTRCGIKALFKDLLFVGSFSKRLKRQSRFENFIDKEFNLTEESNFPDGAIKTFDNYDLLISGSDQIWNKRSWELRNTQWKYMDPYLLRGFSGKKISYASSIGSMNDSELLGIIPLIEKFDYISFRESSVAERYKKYSDKQVEVVLDPTFLLNKSEWIDILCLKKKSKERYILYYSLAGYKENIKRRSSLIQYTKERGCKLYVITPMCDILYPVSVVRKKRDFGPLEFMEAVYNAEEVITDSYHGTILAINFNINFYSYCLNGNSEYRKKDILSLLGLQDRILYSEDELLNCRKKTINYQCVNQILERLREKSKSYLRRSLENEVELEETS